MGFIGVGITIVVSLAVGAIAGIFFYRNNTAKVGKFADIADDAHDAVRGRD